MNPNTYITAGVVDHKSFAYKAQHYVVYVDFNTNLGPVRISRGTTLELYKRISEKDTVLVLYSIECENRNTVYKVFPTHEEIEKVGIGRGIVFKEFKLWRDKIKQRATNSTKMKKS